ncbi:MAG: 2-hydroxyacyl-CoA dehydratase subunit D [Ignavibacteriales bacterium]
MMEIFNEVQEIARNTSNVYLEEALKSGRRIIGYFCSYVPEEVIHAAGFVPYRMRAVDSKGTTQADAYFSPLNCTFVRNCFDKALRGDFCFLDGIVILNGCDHNRRIYDNWRYADIKPDFRYMFVAPHVIGDTARKRFRQEMVQFKEALEKEFAVNITDEALNNSIKLFNKKRRLLAQLYEARKAKNVPIKGSEVLSVVLAVTAMPVEDAIRLLEEVLQQIAGRVVSSSTDLRIFVTGGCLEEVEHLELIESSGAIVVADNLCLGARHFDLEVVEGEDPLGALADRYLNHLSCPRIMNDFRRRLAFMYDAMKDYSVDGVIAEKLKFCDLWGGEMFIARNESKGLGFPLLALEREMYGGSSGQTKTRVQAFFEQVRNNRWKPEDMARTAGDNYQGSDTFSVKNRSK